MKKLGILIAIFGLFALVGVASAATADELQPAQTITYNEELVVNDTLRANSAYIGSTEAGVGGVTFFNGTIVNNSVDDDGESVLPVTFGDDVRIDGEMYRTEVGGENPIKLADTLRPQTTATYDLGTTDNQFNDAYLAGELTVADVTAETVTLTGALTGTTATLTGALTGTTATLTGALTGTTATLTGALTGTTATLTGALTGTTATFTGAVTGTTATFSGDVAATGDINQDMADNGAVKAMIYVPLAGDCTAATSRQWTADDTTLTCSYENVGGMIHTYTIDFGTNDISERYWQVTPSVVSGDMSIATQTFVLANSTQLLVYPSTSAGTSTQSGFMLNLY